MNNIAYNNSIVKNAVDYYHKIETANGRPYNKYVDVPFPEYLSDKTFVSSSMLKKLERSPAHLKAYLEEGGCEETKRHLIFGRAAHARILEPDTFTKNYFIISDDIKKPTKAQVNAKNPSEKSITQIEEWEHIEHVANGREIIREADVAHTDAMRAALLEVPKIKNLLSVGNAEQTRYFIDEDSGVRCKMRADFVHGTEQEVIVDYKTTEDVRSLSFAKTIVNFGYDVQAVHYKVGGQAKHFYIIAQEKKPPYACKLYLISSDWLQRGAEIRKKYLDQYAECVVNDSFPSYPTDTEVLEIPRWA